MISMNYTIQSFQTFKLSFTWKILVFVWFLSYSLHLFPEKNMISLCLSHSQRVWEKFYVICKFLYLKLFTYFLSKSTIIPQCYIFLLHQLVIHTVKNSKKNSHSINMVRQCYRSMWYFTPWKIYHVSSENTTWEVIFQCNGNNRQFRSRHEHVNGMGNWLEKRTIYTCHNVI